LKKREGEYGGVERGRKEFFAESMSVWSGGKFEQAGRRFVRGVVLFIFHLVQRPRARGCCSSTAAFIQERTKMRLP
jgi:hypothetical protein